MAEQTCTDGKNELMSRLVTEVRIDGMRSSYSHWLIAKIMEMEEWVELIRNGDWNTPKKMFQRHWETMRDD